MFLEKFFVEHWQIVSFLIVLVFNAGVVYQGMKNKITKEQAQQMIDEKYEEHCPFSDDISLLRVKQDKNVDNISVLKSKIDNIDFNVQMMAEKMNIKIIKRSNVRLNQRMILQKLFN